MDDGAMIVVRLAWRPRDFDRLNVHVPTVFLRIREPAPEGVATAGRLHRHYVHYVEI
jgi:hypothetical protein